jgi:hypothetical protein
MADLWERMSEGQDRLEGEVAVLGERLERLESGQRTAIERADRARGELEARQEKALAEAVASRAAALRRAAWLSGGALALAAAALIAALLR